MPWNGVLLPLGGVEAGKHHLRAIPATTHPAACDRHVHVADPPRARWGHGQPLAILSD